MYNTYAASAGTLSGSFPTGDATRNLCPAGWRLPTGGQTEGTGEFSVLYDHYRSFYKMRAPVASGGAAFALAGTFSTSTPLQTGSRGEYMSMTRNGGIDYILYIDNNIYPNSTSMTYFGKSIRCIVNI